VTRERHQTEWRAYAEPHNGSTAYGQATTNRLYALNDLAYFDHINEYIQPGRFHRTGLQTRPVGTDTEWEDVGG